jgi:prepilin-type N-terminal cleavage/methylation domain-containing protein
MMRSIRHNRVRNGAWQQAHPRGFTLVEVLITLALIAIVAGMAIPRLDFTKYRSDAAARLIRSTLQQAQRLAIQRQFDVVVSFDTVKNRMRTAEDANDDGTVASSERVTWRPLEEGSVFGKPPAGISGAVGGAVAGTGVKSITSMPSVVFHRDGAASGSIEIYITSKRQKSSDFRALQVTQSTGRVDWYRYVGTAWKAGGI